MKVKTRTTGATPAPLPSDGQIVADGKGRKDDGDKVRLELLPFEALVEVGRVMTFGANKYGADNWRRGMKWRRLIGAALRHIFAFASGESNDPETGLSHLAHAGCCILFLLSYHVTGNGEDDRPPAKMDTKLVC